MQSCEIYAIMLKVMGHYDHLTESEVKELNTYCDEMNEKSIEAQEAQTYKHPKTGKAIYYAP